MLNKQNHSITVNGATKYKGTNILYYGVPGSGKSHTISKNHCSNEDVMERVVFHPDYTFSDFVGQILPRIETNANGDDLLKYVFTPGPFTRILKKAINNQNEMYYLVIEEINRGNAPAIFGEIFQLLDRDKNGLSTYGISNYDVAKAIYNDETIQVRIPSNLTLLATMNTADQNVFVMDTAFQRRWQMRQVENDFDYPQEHKSQSDIIIKGTDISWGVFAKTINKRIFEQDNTYASTEDKRLGVFFIKEDEFDPQSFAEKVLKYLWDDAFKHSKSLIFKEDFRCLDEVISAYVKTSENRLEEVLNNDIFRTMIQEMNQQNNVLQNSI